MSEVQNEDVSHAPPFHSLAEKVTLSWLPPSRHPHPVLVLISPLYFSMTNIVSASLPKASCDQHNDGRRMRYARQEPRIRPKGP